jgi:hypothetical protein
MPMSQVHSVRAGQRGCHLPEIHSDGNLALIDAGWHTGRPTRRASPFHFARTRMTLLEPPHVHTSMVLIADGNPLSGDRQARRYNDR